MDGMGTKGAQPVEGSLIIRLAPGGRGSATSPLYLSKARPKDLVSLSPPPSLRPWLPTQQIFQDTLFREFPSSDISLAAHSHQRPDHRSCVAPIMPCLLSGIARGKELVLYWGTLHPK